jgi:hypothetical protein
MEGFWEKKRIKSVECAIRRQVDIEKKIKEKDLQLFPSTTWVWNILSKFDFLPGLDTFHTEIPRLQIKLGFLGFLARVLTLSGQQKPKKNPPDC